MPFIGLFAAYFALGSRVRGLTLGIVNDEVAFSDACLKSSTNDSDSFECPVNNLSCRFIDTIGDGLASVHFFDSYETAYEAARAGKIVGFLKFPKNFSKSMALFNDDVELDTSGAIEVHLDHTDLQKKTLIQRKLLETFEVFIENVMVSCGKARKAGSQPIVFEAVFGVLDFDFRQTAQAGMIIWYRLEFYFYQFSFKRGISALVSVLLHL